MTRENAAIIALATLAAVSAALLAFSPAQRAPAPARGQAAVHFSTLMGRAFFDKAYEQAPAAVAAPGPIAGGTVNHHLLAAPLDAQFFAGLSAQDPKTVILIGPDHMSRGRATMTAGIEDWRTPYGDVRADGALVRRLAGRGLVSIEENLFDYEFSVGGLMPFVKRSLPDAKVSAIIVRSDADDAALDALAEALPADKDAVVVASIDFSHYLPSRAAEFHDIANRAIVDAFDYADFGRLEIDSPPTLRVLLKYLERRGSRRATLVASTDSAKATGQLDAAETTSYLNQYFSPGDPAPLAGETGLYVPPGPKIDSPEGRFGRGFLKEAGISEIPEKLRLPDLAVGIARSGGKTSYYLFPLSAAEGGRRSLLGTGEERAYFMKHGLDHGIITGTY